MSETPDYVICLECETPAYTFEWNGTQITEAICTSCGNEKPTLFTTEEAYGEMMATDDRHYGSGDD
jgi:hypothetical protein